MTRTDLDRLAEEVLTQLEMKETHLLNWGLVGGRLDLCAEVQRVLSEPPSALVQSLCEKAQHEGEMVGTVLQNLIDRKLVFQVSGEGRTRYAETVKLLYNLKQRFKKTDWMSAANLVSQIKLRPTYRMFPTRNRKWADIRIELTKRRTSPLVRDVIETLTGHGALELSNFQEESLYRLLKGTRWSKDSATIIGAGTGSGKTKAFYLPAFAAVVESVSQDAKHWTRLLGVYPRTELLKDQYREALSEMRALNVLLQERSIRPLTIGAYYGDTPTRASDVVHNEFMKWEQHEDGGYICPFAICPVCSGTLVWPSSDVQAQIDRQDVRDFSHERLVCIEPSCQVELTSDKIMLTRERMRKTPPDLLFTTTEMINRKLSHLEELHVFGVPKLGMPAPLFVLLDEVHIYNGVTGAHVAYVLRRWRQLVSLRVPHASVQVVGLSATLPNPQTFFANLVGIDVYQTLYLSPRDEDMSKEGIEYNAVLRGDPFSATALLSTSVQTAMLLGRMLDPLNSNVSHGAWGKKIFGFTDKLDVINRWFHIEVDAEEKQTLFQYRRPDQIDPSTRKQQIKAGQVWNAALEIDPHGLRNPLGLDITSSQHKGVNPNAQLVIATSTLEVGYNDSQVGAVIQHKSPRNLASFLQRKGRGGRSSGMRPWTVVVTSAYGRDRYVYDYPEQLFSPMLPDLVLPLGNVYVQRIQAAYALMDWLAYRMHQNGFSTGNLWKIISPKQQGKFERERAFLAELLHGLLQGELSELQAFLQSALQVDADTLNRILWTPPRSLVLDLLPGFYAQLQVRWSQVVEGGNVVRPHVLIDAPLYGYVPRNLFSSLEVYELQLETPSNQTHYLGLRQGLAEFAPGNVSKRFVNIRRLHEAHWLPLPKDPVIELDGDAMKVQLLDEVQDSTGTLPVFFPMQYRLAQIPPDVTDRSTGFLQWEAQLDPRHVEGTTGNGRTIELKAHSLLRDLVRSVEVLTSEQYEFVRVTRFARNVKTETKFKSGESPRGLYTFRYRKQPAAIGFQVEADALVFRLHPVDLQGLYENPHWEQHLRALRPAYFFHSLREDAELTARLSIFEIEWLWQICIASVMATAIAREADLREAIEEFFDNRERIAKRSLDLIFQAQAMFVQEGDEDTSKLYKRLLTYLQDESLMDLFLEKIHVLHDELHCDAEFEQWLKQRLQASFGAALQNSLEGLLPDVNVEDLLLDIRDDAIWLTEPDSGGIGIIVRLEAKLRNEPGLFEEVFLQAASHCRRHDLAAAIHSLLPHLEYFSHGSFAELRAANTIDQQAKGLERLQRDLAAVGFTPGRELIVSLTTRVLPGNSSEKTDRLLKRLHEIWHEEEQRLGSAIDARVLTVACLRREEIKEQVHDIFADLSIQGSEFDEKQQFTLIESLLWSDCHDSCPECLQLYSPYQTFAPPDRQLLLAFVRSDFVTVEFGTTDWRLQVLESLQKGLRVRVNCSFADVQACRSQLVEIVLSPVELEYELLYPYVAGVENHGTDWVFDVRLREVQHV